MDKPKFEDYQFESSVISVTDSMGREIFWNDAGRPEDKQS